MSEKEPHVCGPNCVEIWPAAPVHFTVLVDHAGQPFVSTSPPRGLTETPNVQRVTTWAVREAR